MKVQYLFDIHVFFFYTIYLIATVAFLIDEACFSTMTTTNDVNMLINNQRKFRLLYETTELRKRDEFNFKITIGLTVFGSVTRLI